MLDVPGIGPKSLKKIKEAYDEVAGLQDIILFLQSVNVSEKFAADLQTLHGEDLDIILKEDPYQLLHDIPDMHFQDVDKIALAMGVSELSADRISHGIKNALWYEYSRGNSCAPKDQVYQEAAAMLGLSYDSVSTIAADFTGRDKPDELIHEGISYFTCLSFMKQKQIQQGGSENFWIWSLKADPLIYLWKGLKNRTLLLWKMNRRML